MDFIRFIFSSFWIWLGFIILVCCVLKYAVDLVSAIRAKRHVFVSKENEHWVVRIENASHEDVEATLVRQELRENLDTQQKAAEKSDLQ